MRILREKTELSKKESDLEFEDGGLKTFIDLGILSNFPDLFPPLDSSKILPLNVSNKNVINTLYECIEFPKNKQNHYTLKIVLLRKEEA